MSDSIASVVSYLESHDAQYLEELIDFLKIPSISALSPHQGDVRQAAEWLKERLKQAGLDDARLVETPGHPVVLAHYGHDPRKPTVVVYGHYDVQPVDPESLWRHPPFEPTIENDIIYARGASDDKGQVYMQLIAAEAWIRATGDLPVNLVFFVEGEEEIGSPHLRAVIESHQAELQANFAVISDTPMYQGNIPAICYGLRGLAALDVRIDGPFQDLHSGVYGGAVMNPAHALAGLVQSLHTPDGRVAVEGFYDDVAPLTATERDAFARLPFDEEAYREALGVPQLFGEAGYTPLERTWARPTIEVNGMWSGFLGEGRKTIIPSSAFAKLTCRLVPYQNPDKVLDQVIAHLHRHLPPGVRLTVTRGDSAPGSLTPLDHPAVKAAEQAIHAVFQQDPAYIRMGGSIPVVVDFQDVLQMPTVLLGFALPDENFHAPNEHFHLRNFRAGAKTIAHFWRFASEKRDPASTSA